MQTPCVEFKVERESPKYICHKTNLMLQRIQSIYLLASIVLLVCAYFLVFGTLTDPAGSLDLGAYGLKMNEGGYMPGVNTYWFHIPYTIIIILDLAAIFSFSSRMRQLTLIRFSFILYALSFALLSLYIMDAGSKIANSSFTPGIGFFFPIISLVLSYLAMKSIRKDEDLVRSVNRIR